MSFLQMVAAYFTGAGEGTSDKFDALLIQSARRADSFEHFWDASKQAERRISSMKSCCH